MKIYTITNDFHNSSIRLRAEGISHPSNRVQIKLSKAQIRKARRTLCGIDGCYCGGEAGERGPQITESGEFIILDFDALYS